MSVRPVMGLDGWVTDSFRKADYILADYQASARGQSNNTIPVYSLASDVANNAGDPTAMAQKVKQSLTELYGYYFDNVNASVKTQDSVNVSGTFDLIIKVQLTDGDKTFSLSGALLSQDGGTYRFNTLANG